LAPSPSSDGTRLSITIGNPSYIRVFTLGLRLRVVMGDSGAHAPLVARGETIAFVQQYGGTVSVVNSNGTGAHQVSPVGRSYEEGSLTWSTDGAWLLARAAGTLELINVSTGTTLPLGYATQFVEPAWKP